MQLDMKTFGYIFTICVGLFTFSSCDDFLDWEPLDQISSEQYFYSADDLAAYTINYYSFPTHEGWSLGTLNNDNGTDNQVSGSANQSLYVKGIWIVPNNASSWNFERIRAFNYFFENVLPKYEAGEISGDATLIKHYIGEAYFLRAYEYFIKLQTFGDFPIITQTYADNKDELIEASKRRPRNEVARFILEDLDKAIELMSNDVFSRNRLTKDAALLFKSRVALYEATYETYHRGTPRIPGETGWPGAKMDYNADFTIDVDAEIDFFLEQCMDAAKQVADKIALTSNSHQMEPTDSPYGWNPFFEMYSTVDMSTIPEVLFWRAYSSDFILHCVGTYLYIGGNMGLTKGMIDSFLMKDGTPIYASNDYKGDATITQLKEGRDERLQLFVMGEEDLKVVATGEKFGYPYILKFGEEQDVTGYRVKKCFSYDPTQGASSGQISSFGSIVFRAVEAYLNYMEASYMKLGRVDETAARYWRTIRERAGVDTDFEKTIRLTDMNKEKEGDWGAYSGCQLIDATLYNIRRERRDALLSEGLRMMDLKRWRSLDQVNGYIIEGFNLWDEAYKHYDGLIYDGSSSSTVSSPELSKYLRPFQRVHDNNPVWNGLVWSKANYLDPIGFRDMQLASPDETVENSVIYQNPYWPTEAGPALE